MSSTLNLKLFQSKTPLLSSAILEYMMYKMFWLVWKDTVTSISQVSAPPGSLPAACNLACCAKNHISNSIAGPCRWHWVFCFEICSRVLSLEQFYAHILWMKKLSLPDEKGKRVIPQTARDAGVLVLFIMSTVVKFKLYFRLFEMKYFLQDIVLRLLKKSRCVCDSPRVMFARLAF